MPALKARTATIDPKLTPRKTANPLLWFISQMNHPETQTPQAVIDHIERMFQRLPTQATSSHRFDYDLAFLHYQKLSCRLNLLRSQHELMRLTPTDKNYLPASKATAMWIAMDAKFNKARVKELKQRKAKKHGGPSPQGFNIPERQDGGVIMGE